MPHSRRDPSFEGGPGAAPGFIRSARRKGGPLAWAMLTWA